MKEVNQKPEPKSYGQKIRFQIELMALMLQTGRETAALAAINKALELADEAHYLEFPDDR
jgi:hypothetical protein